MDQEQFMEETLEEQRKLSNLQKGVLAALATQALVSVYWVLKIRKLLG